MKKYLLSLPLLFLSVSLSAQLKAPTETVKDTLHVVSMKYNMTTVQESDWICQAFYETPTRIYIAGQVYEKGDAKESFMKVVFPNATVNGKPAKLERCTNALGVVTYVIDGYEIVVGRNALKETVSNLGSAISSRVREGMDSTGETADVAISTQKPRVDAILQGRRLIGSVPSPSYAVCESGTIVVTIWVDQYGNVAKAQAGAEGTTITDKTLWNATRTAALGTHFNQTADAPALQQGTITYKFTLD